MELRLYSPVGAEDIEFQWPLPSSLNPDNDDDAEEIIETIRLTCEDFPQLRGVFRDEFLDQYDPTCYNSLKSLCEYFNGVIAEMRSSNNCPTLEEVGSNLSRDLLEHILVQVYNQTVKEPDKLNQYEPFSPEVYGETSFELVCQMIDHMSISRDDIFIDLGSGVGQVVLQMAALTSCKLCLGIEKADVPSQYAENMSKNFRKWMAWFGKTYGDYKIIKGDFLNEEFREKITSCSLIFVNNFAFGPSVDHNLKQIFADLKDGSRIVSSKAFCPLNFRITDRNLSDIGTIMHVSEMQPMSESVSWTGKPVSYYLHVIDRTKLERYFQKLKQPTAQPKRTGRCSSSNSNSNSREGSVESNGRRSVESNVRKSVEKNVRRTLESNVKRVGNNVKKRTNKNSCRQPKKVFAKWSSDDESSENETPRGSPDNETHGASPDIEAPRVTTRRAWTEYCKTLSKTKNENNGINKKEVKPPKRKYIKKQASPPRVRQRPQLTATARASRSTTTTTTTTAATTKRKRMSSSSNSDKSHKTSVERIPSPPPSEEKSNSTTGYSILLIGDDDNDRRPVPDTLKYLLRAYKTQYLDMMDTMKTQCHAKKIHEDIGNEREKNLRLKFKDEYLKNHIKKLLAEGTGLLKQRMFELGVENCLPSNLLEQAKNVVLKHKNLQIQVAKLEQIVQSLEEQREQLFTLRYKEATANGIDDASSSADELDTNFHSAFNIFPQR